jgi:hypothetical protein
MLNACVTPGCYTRVLTPQLPPAPGLDTVVGALEELQLNTLETRAPGCNQPLDFDFEKLEHQLTIYLGPHPSQENLRALAFTFANVMALLAGGDPLSLDALT